MIRKYLLAASAGAALLTASSVTAQQQLIGLGDSIGKGVQSADASLFTQPSSYLNLIAGQIGSPFPLPLIVTTPLGLVGDTTLRFRLLPFVRSANLAVSGADVNALLREPADALGIFDIDTETDLVLFPRTGSQIEIVESLAATLVVCWIGNNDVLGTVLAFDQLDASQLTPIADLGGGFPLLSRARLGDIFRSDPFIDKDGDGVVTGRPLAGLLETLGPALGISGDADDALPAATASKIDPARGRAFARRYEALTGERIDSLDDAIAALRRVLALDRWGGRD